MATKTTRKPVLGKIKCPICNERKGGRLFQSNDKAGSIYMRCVDCRVIIFGEYSILHYVKKHQRELEGAEWSKDKWRNVV